MCGAWRVLAQLAVLAMWVAGGSAVHAQRLVPRHLQTPPPILAQLASPTIGRQLNASDTNTESMYATSLSGRAGDALRGRALVADRQYSLCLLCHSAPIEEARFQGMLAPDLKTAAAALSEVQLRARIADARRFNPETIMPAYYSADGLQRVAPAYVGKTIFTAQDIEDVVAWLMSLK